MRESIGSVSLLNFIIFFIFLVFAFLAATLSYYKSYRVNNAIVAAIEKFEGFNQYSQKEIDLKLQSFGYERGIDFECPKEKNNGYLVNTAGATSTNAKKGYTGYCVYLIENDLTDDEEKKGTEKYDSYEVVTIMTFHFPVIQDILKLRVSAKTDRIYNFEASWDALGK